MKESFVFYKSFYEAIKKIKDKATKADIYEAICELGLNKNVVPLTNDVGQIIMELVKPQIEANTERYENGKKGGKFGVLGGRPKKDKNPNGVIEETPNVNVNDNVNVNVNENVVVVEDNKTTEQQPHTPTFNELRSYCVENGMEDLDYEYVFNYYEDSNWVDTNGNKIKNWKLRVRTWYKNDKKNGKLVKHQDTSRRLD